MTQPSRISLTADSLAEAMTALPGDWLEAPLAQTSAHWRLRRLPELRHADATLRALFLVAYQALSDKSPVDPFGDDLWVRASDLDPSNMPSTQARMDDTYGDGFYEAVRTASLVLIEHAPGSERTRLLSAFSDFLRFGVPGLSGEKGSSAREIETVWERMDIGWIN